LKISLTVSEKSTISTKTTTKESGSRGKNKDEANISSPTGTFTKEAGKTTRKAGKGRLFSKTGLNYSATGQTASPVARAGWSF
jgi:hypothetical protein